MTDAVINRMSQDIHNQDNAITAEPIFMVQEKKRIYGIDTDYDHTGTEFTDPNDPEADASLQARAEAYDAALTAGELEPLIVEPYSQWREKHAHMTLTLTQDEWDARYKRFVAQEKKEHFLDFCSEHYTEVGYRDIWVNVQPFFTRVGAEAYLEINGHNLKEPRIYVESAFRNAEWQAMRKLLQNRGLEDGWISVRSELPTISTTDGMAEGLYRSDKVLAFTGKETYSAFLQYDTMGPPFEEPPRWKIADSEEWDLGNSVTHWRRLPAPPKEKRTEVDDEQQHQDDDKKEQPTTETVEPARDAEC